MPDKIKNTTSVEHQHEITLPTAQQFGNFYTELTELHRLSAEFKDNKLLLKAFDTIIEISAGAVIELIADKLRQPLNLTTDLKLQSNPQFIDDIDIIITKKLQWAQGQFGRICMDMGQPETNALCETYHRTLSLPLIAKIRYLEWKHSLMNHIVERAKEEVEVKKNEEIAQIRREYKEKSEQDQIEARKKTEYLEKKVQSLTEINRSIDAMRRQGEQDIRNLRGEAEELDGKCKEAETKASKLEADLTLAKRELESVNAKLKQHDGNNGWEEDVTSTPEKPVYINTHTKKIIELPEGFKENYRPSQVAEDEILYKYNDSEFRLPIPLSNKLRERTSNVSGGKNGDEQETKEKIKLLSSEKKVLDALKSSSEPLTVDKISSMTGIHTNHLYAKYLKKLVMVHKLVKEDEENGVKVFSIAEEEE